MPHLWHVHKDSAGGVETKKKDKVTRYTYLKCSSGKAHNKRKEDRVWYINTSKKENWFEKHGKEATGPTCILPNHREELIENLIDLEIQKLFFEDAIIELPNKLDIELIHIAEDSLFLIRTRDNICQVSEQAGRFERSGTAHQTW
jgi:hypothetical protein